MALPIDIADKTLDPRALKILAKSIYKDLRASGYREQDVMTFAGELLALVSSDVKGRQGGERALSRDFARCALEPAEDARRADARLASLPVELTGARGGEIRCVHTASGRSRLLGMSRASTLPPQVILLPSQATLLVSAADDGS